MQQQTAAQASDYSQPINTTAAAPEQSVASQAASAYDQARAAFKSGDYAQAIQLDQQALAQTPNDTDQHEFLALTYFAQGKYPQAAAPLYAVLSVRPGWDWTTLCGMYPDVDTYTTQLRALEAYVRSNPDSAQAHFVLAYQYLSRGMTRKPSAQLKEVVRLQPERHALGADHRGVPTLGRQRHRRPPRRPRPRRRPIRESWQGHGPPHRPRARRLPWRSRTAVCLPGPQPARASPR